MPDIRLYIILFLALMVSCFLLGRHSARGRITYTEKETIWKTDTITVHDTIRIEKPAYVTRYVRDSILVKIRDTVFINLPKEVKVYEDERYRAEVSGYQPNLDNIDIFVPERIITQEKIQYVEQQRKKARWGIGVQVGYGISTCGNIPRFSPYVGVGVSYNILTF